MIYHGLQWFMLHQKNHQSQEIKWIIIYNIYHNISLSIISDMHMRFPLIWWYPTVDTFSTEITMATFHPHFRTPPLYIYIYVCVCYVVLCYVVVCYIMLCYVMLYIHTVICIHVHTYTYIIYTYMYVYKYIHIYISPSSSSSSPIGSMVLVH